MEKTFRRPGPAPSPLTVALLAVLACLALCPARALAEGSALLPQARRGALDLSGLRPGEAAPLDGQWEFHWQAFVSPSLFASGEAKAKDWRALPGEWSSYAGLGLPPTGYATYRLLVTGLDPDREYGLRMGSFLSAATVFVNGAKVFGFGTPGTTASSEDPGWLSLIATIHPDASGRADVVIHLSNFHDRAGGLRTTMLLGDYGVLSAARDRLRAFELFSLGALLAMGLYYLALFAFRRTERSSLFFGLVCIVLALRVACYDEYFILDLFPGLSWDWLFRLGYLTFSLAVLLTALFIAALFPRRSWKPASWAIAAVCVAYSAAIALAPPLFFSGLLTWFQGFTGAVGLYIVGILVYAIAARERGSLLFLGGFILFFATTIHDMLVANGIIQGTFLVQYGLLVFLFSMSLVITRKLADAYARTESLSSELVRTNRSMKRFVPEEFLLSLGRDSIEQVCLGDHAKREMSVMFADIRSFSTLSERMSPEDTFRFINQYLARMGPTIRSNGGFVDKYMGDGIMALFPGCPEDAARCAIDMHMRLCEYNVQRSAQGEAPIRIGVGIHTGGIMLGTIGENERMDGTVISDAVNVASRMESLAKEFGVGIVASESILAGLADPGEYRARYLGKVGVKGRREPISIFELYDGEPEEERARKDELKDPFEAALAAFYAQDYTRALALFRDLTERFPEDEATQYYTRMIRRLKLA